ncbi:MAG: hypothetical protein LBH72_05990 [Proteiniphilum sp.]|jgi:hypothetical protein|nr:hypothetical protein [Proteiniphilum sp.]
MTSDIRRLLEKYFEGNSSVEEERALRRRFAQGEVPGELGVYTALFRFLDEESAALTAPDGGRRGEKGVSKVVRGRTAPRKRLWRRLGMGMAAASAAAILVAVLLPARDGSCAWVDGERITNPVAVRRYAESSFGKVQPENDIIEDQLRFMLEYLP